METANKAAEGGLFVSENSDEDQNYEFCFFRFQNTNAD